jgi:hypothetical protein
MKKLATLLVASQLLMAIGAYAARPALPEGWRLPEWWDLEGKDRPFLMADFNGSGAIDMATLAVRDDSDIMALLVWYTESGKEKWVVVDQQKRPRSLSGLRFEPLTDESHPKRSNILLCMARNECRTFSWDEQSRTLKRSVQVHKSLN